VKKIVYSTVASVTDEQPKKQPSTWENLAKRLSQVAPRGKYRLEDYLALPRDKKRSAKGGPGWIPGEFKPGGKRQDSDLRKLYCFVGDVDNNSTGVPVTMRSIKEVLNGYSYVIHTTYSHSREKAKFRFVVPFNQPITRSQYDRVFSYFNDKLSGGLDPKGKTPSQLYFWPSCPQDAKDFFKYSRGYGKPFNAERAASDSKVEVRHPLSSELTINLPDELPVVKLKRLKLTKRIRELIETGEDSSHQYVSRSEALFAVAIALASHHATDAQIASILLNPKYAISKKTLEQKNPRKYVINTLKKIKGMQFVGTPETVSTVIADLNSQHAVINVGGRCLILTESEDPILHRREYALSYPNDVRLLYANKKLIVDEKPINIGDLWMQHEQRRQYSRLVFSPERDIPGCYNLWRGFAVEPKKGNCGLYLDHIKDNIAQGDEEIYKYIIAFMADAVQRPSRLPGVAFVMRGDEGVGKGILASEFGKLFGQHYIQVSNARHLVGNFNAHLKDTLVVYADEAFWAGDKSSQGVLNAVITEELRILEHKGKDPITVANMCRLIIASNHDWIVPAGLMARRFFVVDVGNLHRQDRNYFGMVRRQMESGGREALLYFLLNYDLSDIDINNFPRTEALLDQQIRTFNADQRFWYDRLCKGEMIDFTGRWGRNGRVTCQALHEQYVRSLTKDGYTRRSSETEFGLFLRKICPKVRHRRRRFEEGQRMWIYEFPSLDDCREAFEDRMNTPIKWPKI
jgi:hypothetical protein